MVEISTPSGGGFVDPNLIVSNLPLVPGMRAADFGSGAGHFVVAMARLVGESGRVIAVDVLESALAAAKARATAAGLNNVETLRANLELLGGTKLPDQSLGVVLIANTLYQAKERGVMLAEAARVLAADGVLAVVDWDRAKLGLGPPVESRLSVEEVGTLAQGAGLQLVNQFPAGDWHFGLIFKKI